jgi:ligand-binding sensor domain-containing protein/signal transduction histidine kinase/DNA-binding response OmpR family regulator
MRPISLKNTFFFKKIVVLAIVCFQAYSCLAQNSPNLKFKKYGIEDGLSQVTSKCLLEDEQGYIWIGTQDGLNRFDGYSFKIFRNDPEKTGSLSSSYINCMIQLTNGQIIIGTTAGINRYYAQKESFDVYQNQPEKTNSLSHNNVTALLEDSKGRIWAGTENGLNLIDLETWTFERYRNNPNSSNSLSNNFIKSLMEDKAGNIWVGTKNGLNLLNEESQSFLSFHPDSSKPSSLSDNEITKIFQDRDGQIWVGTTNGLNRLDSNGSFRRYVHDSSDLSSISDDHILSIFQDTSDNLWIGTSNGGLNLYNYSASTFVRYQHNADDPSSISNNTIWSMIEDRTGNLWIGVSNSGINFHDPRTQNFEHIKYQPNSNVSLLDNAVRSILLDDEEQLWVGSFTGLTVINRRNNRTRHYQHNADDPNSLNANYVISLFQDHQNRIWIGTSKGLNIYDPQHDQFIRYQGNQEIPIKNLIVETIMEDYTKGLWIGTYKNGMYQIDLEKGFIKKHIIKEDSDDNQPKITTLFQDSKQRIWAGTDAGLYLLNPQKESFEKVNHKSKGQGAISNVYIMNISEDLKGNIWIGTTGGFNLLDSDTDIFKSYHTKNGLSNDVIYGVLVDAKGFIWLSTNKGINRFDPETEVFTIYDQDDGLQSNEFNSRAYHKDKNGFLYFGGVNGLSVFHPDSVSDNTVLPPVVLTDFLLFNKPVNISDTSVLTISLNHLDEIILDYDQSMFAFEFSALNYKQPEKNKFAYKLHPFNKDWIYTNFKDRKAVFTSVPPGNYTFQVKASNDDGYWNEKGRSIQIRILPPWWLTWWAITLYMLISILTIGLIVYFQWRRVQLKNRLKLEQKEAEQFKILDQLKTQFFSNITHEFRTPLTLIIGPSEQILKQPKLDESFTRTQIEMVLRNSRKFLHLINQLLDLSKLESKQMSLDLYQGDFSEFVKKIVEQFDNAAKQKKIRLDFSSKLSVNDYLFDRDKMDKILFNLLSNALKFTPEGGLIQVRLQVKEGTDLSTNPIVITIEDSGIGIPEDQLPKIFDRFYQVDSTSKRKQEGTGIGLALTKELVKVHDGTIEVESNIEKGTTFTITLPLEIASDGSKDKVKENPSQDQFTFSSPVIHEKIIASDITNDIDPESERPIVLIIEDNDDLRNFIDSIMREAYQTITAKDGIEGIEYALKFIPDLIISDVMMPGKDGFEVTHTLKSNPLSSHIPIILLTAKSTLKSRVKGLQEGANAYLTKPFNVEELILVATQQIETRKLMQAKFANNNDQIENETTYKKTDQELINRLHAFIEIHLSNEELTVDELVKEVGMSHSQLYRKIKALTDLSIASFIRNYRLIRALELLKAGEHNVTEVATMTGFGDRRYFHKVFVDKFNYPPSKILKKKISNI